MLANVAHLTSPFFGFMPLIWGDYDCSARVPSVRHCAYAHVRRSRDVPALRELPAGGAPRRPGDLLPAARQALRRMPARSTARLRARRGYLLRLRVFLLLL